MSLLPLWVPSALAQLRILPEDTQRGVMAHVQDVIVSVDGKNLRLAAGGNIRDRNNLIIVPSALPPGGALAEYVLDMNGQISRAWLLTDDEARRPRKKPAGN
jgi:hypothetical protein